MKRLRAEIAAGEHEAAQLDTQQQHMQRQLAALAERLARLEHQVYFGKFENLKKNHFQVLCWVLPWILRQEAVDVCELEINTVLATILKDTHCLGNSLHLSCKSGGYA